MKIFRGFRYKLAPSVEQIDLLRQFAGVCRLVYNLGLEQRQNWWRKHSSSQARGINFYSQCAELKLLRKEFDFIEAVYSTCLEQSLRDLDDAFKAFFCGRAKYPCFKSKDVANSFRFKGREIAVRRLNKKWSALRVPKIGWVKFRDTRPLEGDLRNVTIGLEADGWHVSFACEIAHEAPAPQVQAVGIDRGITTTLALSTGELLTLPASLTRLEAQKRRAQRVVSRRKRGSNRRRRAQKRASRLQAQQARIRRDFHHRAALCIARRFGVAVLEDLNTKSMTVAASGTVAEPGRNVRQKAGLNRAILNAGWRQFQTLLTYKMSERGGRVVTVPARFTSQTCAACGIVDARSRESQACFVCVDCGHTDHADTNAAINIERRWSTSLLDVEGLHKRPREASTKGSLRISADLRSQGRSGC